MSSINIADYVAYLKQYYNSYSPYNLTYKAGPYYAMLNKMTRAGGKNTPVPQQFGNNQSTSSNYTVASNSAGSPLSLAEFLVPSYPTMYSLCNIDEQLIAAGRDSEFAFANPLQLSIDSSLREHGKKIAIYLLGDGSGALATVQSVSSNTVYLVDPTHARRFSLNQQIITSGTLFSSAPTNVQTVVGVNAQLGTVTFDTLPTGTVAGWYLFNNGDYATSLGNKIVGFQGWIPPVFTAPWTTLFGVDRTQDETLLAGIRVNASGLTVKQAMIQGVQNLVANGADVSSAFKIFMHPIQYAVLLQQLEGSRVYTQLDTKIEGLDVSFKGVKYEGSGFDMEIYQDMWVDSDKIMIADFDKWHFENTKHAVMMTSDGLDLLRLESQDAVQLRIRTYGQQTCSAVAWNAICYGLTTSV